MLACRAASAIVVIVAALAALAACNKASEDRSVTASDGKQRVQITADSKGFTPSSVTLKKGQPAALVFTRTTDETCAKEVVFAETGLKKDLPLNKPTEVDVPTTDARTLAFACGMGMLKGSVIVQ